MPDLLPFPTTDQENQSLQEFINSRGESLRVDHQSGVLRGVKLLGLASRNGRRYQPGALRQAIGLYEEAKVNVNHPKGDPLGPRDYQDRIGVIRNVEFRPGEGLFGSLHFNPRHTLAEQLVWDAEHAPENVGLSHNVLAKTSHKAGELVVEAISKVQSVDLVADPATTNGLFEHQTQETSATEIFDWQSVTLEQLELQRPDLLATLGETHQAELAIKEQQLAKAYRQVRINELLLEHDLPLPGARDPAAQRITSEAFLRSLLVASDEELEQLVADRAEAIAEASRHRLSPQSREQTQLATIKDSTTNDTASFVAAVTRR